jgi:release factor glutamine methyltransferase
VTRGAAVLAASGIETGRLDAECLLAHALGTTRLALAVEPGAAVPGPAAERFARLLARRARREPLALLTGVREFWSLPLAVRPGVLIPRPETERVVEVALDLARGSAAGAARRGAGGPIVVDVGTGSGAIALALARELEGATVYATEASPVAAALAAENARALGVAGRVRVLGGDLLAPLAGRGLEGRIALIVANPPYIRTADLGRLPAEVRLHEPREALDGGADGLRVHRALAAQAPALLAPGGCLVLEIGWDQGQAAAALLRASAGYAASGIVQDLAGRDRVAWAVTVHR